MPCVDRLRICTDKSLAGTTIFTADLNCLNLNQLVGEGSLSSRSKPAKIEVHKAHHRRRMGLQIAIPIENFGQRADEHIE